MTDRLEIAKLYSEAHKERARYWDYSASREEVRSLFRNQNPPDQVQAQAAGQPRRPGEKVPPAAPTTVVQAPFSALAAASPQAKAPAPPGELAGTRWYALHSVLTPAELNVTSPIGPEVQPPIMTLFSLAGGVGKTCLVATLGRALSAFGEHVLLADTAVCGPLPFYFGSRELRPGVVRIFSPPGAGDNVPVEILNLQAERYARNGNDHDPLLEKLKRDQHQVSRILVDVATASRDVTSRLLSLRPAILVPVLPDMSSLASLEWLEAMPARPLFVLNQFDASSPLHQDVRAMLRQRLGDRLLPFVLRQSPTVSEALAEGMTVIDYAPDSVTAEDYWMLARWLRSFAPPAEIGERGARWRER